MISSVKTSDLAFNATFKLLSFLHLSKVNIFDFVPMYIQHWRIICTYHTFYESHHISLVVQLSCKHIQIIHTDGKDNKLAPYWTDDRLFTTDISAKFKAMWHKKIAQI